MHLLHFRWVGAFHFGREYSLLIEVVGTRRGMNPIWDTLYDAFDSKIMAINLVFLLKNERTVSSMKIQ